MGPEDEHPVQYIHIKVTSKDGTPITHIHVVVIYIPPRKTKQQALVDFLQNQMHNYNNVVVLGDVNVDSYTSSSRHDEKIEKSKFGQIIDVITRPASGTLLDHIYVKAFPLPNQSKRLADRVETMVKPSLEHSGVMLTNNHVGDHDLIFCVLHPDYYREDLSDPTQAYFTLLKSMGVNEFVAISDIYHLAQRLAQYFIRKVNRVKQGNDIAELSTKRAETPRKGLSISAHIVQVYYNDNRRKYGEMT